MNCEIPDYPAPLFSLSWIAIRAIDHNEIVRRLGIRNPEPCNWAYAQEITQKYGTAVFVSPPVDGWVLIAGNLPFEASQPSAEDPLLSWLRQLSEQFDEVQYFNEDNSCPYATWAWLKEGEIIRAYAFRTDPSCDVLWNVGQTTQAEREAGYAYGDSGYEGAVEREQYNDWLPYEEATEEIASQWSLNPCAIDKAGAGAPSVGVMGTMPVPWLDDENDGTNAEAEDPMVQCEEIESIIQELDPIHLLELFCADKEVALPVEVRESQIECLEDLISAFSKVLPLVNPAIREMPDEVSMQIASAICGASLKYYRDRLRRRTR